MTDIEKLTQEFFDQGKDDCFGIWEIVDTVKENLLVDQESEVKRLTMTIVRHLLENGLQAGESPYAAGDFFPWGVQDIDQVMCRIEKEWNELGHDPNIWELVWFGKAEET